jgi:exonuclease III
VATWNVQNYLLRNRYEEGRFRFEYPMPEQRKTAIRLQILEARPDIIFLQELGSSAYLKELQMDLAAMGLVYPHAAFSAIPDASSGLAVLSLLPLKEQLFHYPVAGDGLENALKRGIQEVAVAVNGTTYRCFHVHLKSRYSTEPGDPESKAIRKVEITALAAFMDRQLNAQRQDRLIVLGDFNALFDDPILGPLGKNWAPLPAFDLQGLSWTYHHRKSGARECLDGFWIPRLLTPSLQPGIIRPAYHPPSDHRLVMAPLFFEKRPCAPPLNDN